MFLLGILSVLQITLIPGFILFHFVKLKTESLIKKYLYIFALSLFLNYSLVTVLTLLKFYTISSLWIILIIELICLLILAFTKKITLSKSFSLRVVVVKFLNSYRVFPTRIKMILGLSIVIILFYFALFISNLGTIFYFVDTVNLIHWNTWAKDFANNMLPVQSSHFPQLIPANWSIPYVLTGNSDISFFAKSFMPLFFWGNLLIFIDLSIWKKNYVYLVGLIIYGVFAPIIYPLVFIADGNGDLPVSFFTFLTFYAFLRLSKDKFITSERLLFFLFAAMAATTKLAGFYVFLFASTFSLYGFIKYWKEIDKSKIILILIIVPLTLAISLFWHFLKPEVMVSGLHQPEYVGENYILIFIKAAKLMYYNWGLPVLAYFILTILASLLVKHIRYLTLLMVIPPTILWMFKYSSDFRNLSFVIPFLGFASAFGLIKIIEIAKNKPIITNFDESNSNSVNLLASQKIVGALISIFTIGMFFLINTDFFYNLLLQVHKFISIYYFQSHRINLLIDYTQYISVDYFQNVLAVFFLIIPATYILAITNIKLHQLSITVLIAAIIFNFTLFKEENIVNHQTKLVDQVDARNYGDWMNSIVESMGLKKNIYTNFRAISTEKIPGDLKFNFLSETESEKRLSCTDCEDLFLLKSNLLEEHTRALLDSNITANRYKVLYDDGSFLFIIMNPR